MINFVKKHWLALFIIFNITLISGAVAIIINHQSKTSTIDILTVPSDSTILLNGKPYQNGEYDIQPGEYKLEIKKDDFETKTVDFTIEKNQFKRLYYYLLPKEGLSYYNSGQHANDIYILQQIAEFNNDEELRAYLTSYEKKISIESILPLVFQQYTNNYNNYIEYTIALDTSKNDCPKILCLKIIDTTGGNEQNAFNLIKEKGYNPDDYEIEYIYEPIEPLE